MKTEWTVSNIENAKYIGLIEFQDDKEEFHVFEVLQSEERLVFGGASNIGFLESGYMPFDNCFSLDENLQELVADLECFYEQGYQYCNQIVVNERM